MSLLIAVTTLLYFQVTIGRGLDITYQLVSKTCPLMISRKHCIFQQNEEGQWTVKDNKVQRPTEDLVLWNSLNGIHWFGSSNVWATIQKKCDKRSMGMRLSCCALPAGNFSLLQQGCKLDYFLYVDPTLGLAFFRPVWPGQGHFAVCELVWCHFLKKYPI